MRCELVRLIGIGFLLNFVVIGFPNESYSEESELETIKYFADFQCKNGLNISAEDVCDGLSNCLDESDETLVQCMPEFRIDWMSYCVYGPQIAKDKICDGQRDCADNSDEYENYCEWYKANDTTKEIMESQLRGLCINDTIDKFECQSNECIIYDQRCDGKIDCSNGLDETPEICMRYKCGTEAFTCGYGACVDTDKLCNGVADCADGSDEILDKENCNKSFALPQLPKLSELLITHYDGYCHVPPKNDLKIVTISSAQGMMNRNNIVYVKLNMMVMFGCEKGYTLSGDTRFICGKNDKWSSGNLLPKCEKYCKLHPESITYKMYCSYDGTTKECAQILPPNTNLIVRCAYNYHQPENFLSSVKCQENGEWSGIVEPCKQTCGEIEKARVPFAYGGIAVNTSGAPWEVAIYRKVNISDWHFLCSGTILNADWILTAAHCVVNRTRLGDKLNVYAASDFLVLANKEYRDYNQPNKLTNSFNQNIKAIYLHPDYKDALENYLNDVALMHLAMPMSFSINVRPICGPTVEMFKDSSATNNTNGKFAAYNFKQIANGNLVLVPGKIILNDINDKQFLFYLQFNAESHQGDSGSGIFIEFNSTNHIIGVLSAGHGVTANRYLFVTNLLSPAMIEFIRNYIPFF